LFHSTCHVTLHFFKSTHPSVCPLLPMHRGMSAFMTSASSGAHAGLSCTVYAPNPPSQKYKVQQESARSLTIRISQVFSLRGSFSLSLSVSFSLLSLFLSIYLSLFRPLISLLISLWVTLSDSHTFSLASKCWSVFGSACDQARQMGVNLAGASNV
jgi:uncharacterized protein YqhQ